MTDRRRAAIGGLRRAGRGTRAVRRGVAPPRRVLWLSASTGVTLDGSTRISSWADQSAFSNTMTQPTAGLRLGNPQDVPAVGVDSARSPVDAVPRWIERATGFAGVPAGKMPWIYVIMRHLTTGSFTSTVLESGSGGGVVDTGISMAHVAGNTVVKLALAGGARTITYDDSSEDSFRLYTICCNDDGTADLRINNSIVASAAASADGLAAAQDQFSIGVFCDHTGSMNADLIEIIVDVNVTAESHAATIADIDNRHSYLGL